MAVIYTAISIAAQRLLSNPKKMREIQIKVGIMQKEMNEMLKRNAPQEEMMKKQSEFMPLLGEQMKSSMKPMLVIFPLLLITYYVIIPHLPFISSSNLSSTKSLFFIIVLIMGFASAGVVLVYDRMKMKKEAKILAEQNASANQSPANNQ
jgi:uncharacterized membrane protein (DUF106 family)